MNPAVDTSSERTSQLPRRLRILVADDERDTVLTLMELLREEGHETRGVYKGTDAVVRAMATFNGPQFTGEQRPFVNASLAATLSRVPGVAAAEGSAYGYTRLIGKDGKALGNPANGAPTLGGNWNQVAALNPWHLLAGHAPQAADQVVIDKKSATDGRLRVGDFTTVLVKGPPQRVQVVGIIGFGTADRDGMALP